MKKFTAIISALAAFVVFACGFSACGGGEEPEELIIAGTVPEGYTAYTPDISYRFALTSDGECPGGTIRDDRLHSSLELEHNTTYYLVLDCAFTSFDWAGDDFTITTIISDNAGLEATINEATTGRIKEEIQNCMFLLSTNYIVPEKRNSSKTYRVVYELKIKEGVTFSANLQVDGMAPSDPFDMGGQYFSYELNANAASYSVTGIYSAANSLGKISMPAAYGGKPVTGIKADAFKNCTLEDLVIPDSVTKVEYGAFNGCESLKTTENNVIYAGGWAIGRVQSDNYIIKEGTKGIADRAFYSCSTCRRELTIPDSVLSIGEEAFAYAMFTGYNLSENVTSIGKDAFTSADFDGGWVGYLDDWVVAYTGYVGSSGNKYPETIKEGTKGIADGVFSSTDSLTEVTMPDGLKYIGNEAFAFSRANINNIPDSVIKIGDGAFKGCNIEEITIPDGVTYIADMDFTDCYALRKINLPKEFSATRVCFYGCEQLEEIPVPDGVTFIDLNAFYNCTAVKSIDLPETVTTIGGQAFMNCTGLTEIELPPRVTTIGFSAFANCTGLTSFSLPSTVTSIGKSILQGCVNLKHLSLALIGDENSTPVDFDYHFDNYYQDIRTIHLETLELTGTVINDGSMRYAVADNLIIGPGITTVGNYAFAENHYLQSVTVAASVQAIGEDAFSLCENLTSVTFAENSQLTRIGSGAFSCTGIKNMTIPANVNFLGQGLFYLCWDTLESLTFENSKGWKTSQGNLNLGNAQKNAYNIVHEYYYDWYRE